MLFGFSKKQIVDQLKEPRPLPVGMAEFEEWSTRIIDGSLLLEAPGVDKAILRESMKFTIASMILTLGPTESHKPDAHFIHGLRKAAANQIAHTHQQLIHKVAKARLSAEEKMATIGTGGSLSLVKEEASEVLGNKKV